MTSLENIRSELLLPADVIYLDNAATAPRIRKSVERITYYYQHENANVHRGGSYELARHASQAYEDARRRVAHFLGAEENEIVFTKSATEAANLLANALTDHLRPRENIVVTALEHHANYLPWQRTCRQNECELRVVPARSDGTLDMRSARRMIDKHTKLVCLSAMSNVNGYLPDLATWKELAHRQGSLLILDAAQAAAHIPIDVRSMDCDFLFLSAHKLGGPMGVGVLYGRWALLNHLEPWLLGGGIVEDMHDNSWKFKQAPWRFEAGTPDVAGALGFAAALDFWEEIGHRQLLSLEQASAAFLRRELALIPQLHIWGEQAETPLLALYSDRYGAYDLSVLLAQAGIATRSGRHCAFPLFEQTGHPNVCRLSISFYHTRAELEYVVETLNRLHLPTQRSG